MEQHRDRNDKARNPYWQEFLRTGSVKAYLDYKRSTTREG